MCMLTILHLMSFLKDLFGVWEVNGFQISDLKSDCENLWSQNSGPSSNEMGVMGNAQKSKWKRILSCDYKCIFFEMPKNRRCSFSVHFLFLKWSRAFFRNASLFYAHFFKCPILPFDSAYKNFAVSKFRPWCLKKWFVRKNIIREIFNHKTKSLQRRYITCIDMHTFSITTL